MANQAAKEQIVRENETMQNVELKITKSTPNYYLKTLRSSRVNIMVQTILVMLIMGTFCHCRTKELSNKMSKPIEKLTVELKPNNSSYVMNTYELRETVLDLEENAKIAMNHIRLLTGMIEGIHSYKNDTTRQRQKSKTDFALLYTGNAIFNISKTDPTPTCKYEISGFTIYTGYAEPTEMLKPDIIPGKCFIFFGDFGRIQIEISEKIVIYVVMMENAHQSFIGEEIIRAPKLIMAFSFQGPLDDNMIELTFQYVTYGPATQTFMISMPGRMEFQFVELRIFSKHGREEMTCVYRFHVHAIPQ